MTWRFGAKTWIAAVLCVFLSGQASRDVTAANTASTGSRPEVNPPAIAIEVTQVTQSWLVVADRIRGTLDQEISGSDEMVPLVRGKRTVVRIYPSGQIPAAVIGTTEVILTCHGRDGVACPGPVTLKPLSPVAPDSADGNDLEALRRDAARTWNFVLPDAWTVMAQSISLMATLITPISLACPTCSRTSRMTVSNLVFHPTAPLEIHILYACVRRHAGDPPSVCDHAPLDIHESLFSSDDSLIVRTFPVARQDFHVTLHNPITVPVDGDFSLPGGPLTSDLLAVFEDHVCSLAGSAPLPVNVIYFGIVPTPTVGFTGLGERNCIVSRVDSSQGRPASHDIEVVAHELGHALGRPHAGCGVHGEPPPCEPALRVFPCISGGICNYGFDTAHLQVIDPTDSPGGYHVHDIMSYGGGGGIWVSPYTYRHLYNKLQAGSQGEIQGRGDPTTST